MIKKITLTAILGLCLVSCGDKLVPVREDAVKPAVITEETPHDTDDPSIWINPDDATKSVIIGTDKDTDGALYMYDLNGKIIKKSITLKRPNNVDVAYGISIAGIKVDVAVTTERENKKIRILISVI